MRATHSLKFWKIADGQLIGRIECVGRQGLIFTHTALEIRQTSSNFAEGAIYNMAIHDENLKQTAIKAMLTRKNATVSFEQHVFNFPWRGDTLDTYRVTGIVIDARDDYVKKS